MSGTGIRVAFTHEEYYPVLHPVLDPLAPENAFIGEDETHEVDQALLDRWTKAKAEFDEVQELFGEIEFPER